MDSVVLAVNSPLAPWTASANAPWLHLSAANQSGTGGTNVVFTFDANPGPTRTGTLTIAGLTLTVTQVGSTYVAANPVTTLVGSGSIYPVGVAVDDAGNVYIADYGNHAIKELPRAFVDPTARVEPAAAGSDVLPVVLPATQNLRAPFAPASDQPWLTISGVANGVVSFAFTANPTVTSRTAHITLLGQTIAVTQSAPVTPLTNWTLAGTPNNNGSGLYQFATPTTTNDPQRHYRVRSP